MSVIVKDNGNSYLAAKAPITATRHASMPFDSKYASVMVSLLDLLPRGCFGLPGWYVAGGFVRDRTLWKQPRDCDVFFREPAGSLVASFEKELSDAGWVVAADWPGFGRSWQRPNQDATRWSTPVQVITGYGGNPGDVIAGFDFFACMMALEPIGTSALYWLEEGDAVRDSENNTLKYNWNSKGSPWRSLRRAMRFRKAGWKSVPGDCVLPILDKIFGVRNRQERLNKVEGERMASATRTTPSGALDPDPVRLAEIMTADEVIHARRLGLEDVLEMTT